VFAKTLQKELTARYVKKDAVEAKPLAPASAVQAGLPAKHEVPRTPAAAAAPRKYITVTPQPGKRI
jgi:hypothetical protein